MSNETHPVVTTSNYQLPTSTSHMAKQIINRNRETQKKDHNTSDIVTPFAKATRTPEASTTPCMVLARQDYKVFAYSTNKYDLAVTQRQYFTLD